MTKRAHIPYPQQLAAALRELGGIPYDHAKLMSAEQVISLFQRDHGILHATDPINEHWNITWRLRAEHREKSKRDTAIVAKSKRIVSKRNVHLAALAANATIDEVVADVSRRMKQTWASRKLQSRPFPKIKRPLRRK